MELKHRHGGPRPLRHDERGDPCGRTGQPLLCSFRVLCLDAERVYVCFTTGPVLSKCHLSRWLHRLTVYSCLPRSETQRLRAVTWALLNVAGLLLCEEPEN